MLNEGIRTREFAVHHWLLDPDASDADIVDCMRLPAGLSIEELLLDEMAATEAYQRAWSANCEIDTGELFLRNSTCKRVLYLSAPIFLPDTLPLATFVPTGVNTRIHLYQAPDPQDAIRLEAVSSYELAGLRFRYALSIQYARDAVGYGWQVIRPVIILDSGLLRAVRGEAGRALLERLLECLRRLVLTGSHDYVHATVLNWFPPPPGLPPSYAAIMSERAHPPEIDEWHGGTQLPLPADLLPGRATPQIATLELYSLLVHAGVIARLADDEPALLPHTAALLSVFGDALDEFTLDGLDRASGLADAATGYFATLVGWFVVSALPLRSELLGQVCAKASSDLGERAFSRLETVHGGMFDAAASVDPARFPWQGGYVGVHKVTSQYEAALRGPALATYASYLLQPRRGADPRSWAETFTMGAALCTVLDRLKGGAQQRDLEPVLTRLARDDAFGALQRAAARQLPGGSRSWSRGERYALELVAGLARLAGAAGRVSVADLRPSGPAG